ncbi:hypothetical protein V1264_022656 [Littorina saxatilis]
MVNVLPMTPFKPDLTCSEYLQPAKTDSLFSSATLKGEIVLTGTSKHASSHAVTIQDMDAAKRAVAVIMDIPECLVQLVIDAHLLDLDPSLAFTNSEQLARAAQDIADSPQRQGDLAWKIHQAQKQQRNGESARPGVKMSEAGLGASTMGDCQMHLAGMSEACQSATACSTSTPPSATPQQKHDEQDSTPSTCSPNTTETSSYAQPRSVEMQMHHKGQASTTPSSLSPSTLTQISSSSPKCDVTPTLTPKEQLRRRVQVLAAENRKLKDRKVCRACQKVDLAESGITFLPCGHFITCETCSEMFDDCPACGKNIMGTVRTFLS